MRDRGVKFFSIAVFENQEELHPKVINQVNDAIDKPFSSFEYAKKRIPELIDTLFMAQTK